VSFLWYRRGDGGEFGLLPRHHFRLRARAAFRGLALLAFSWIPAASSIINHSLDPLMPVYSAATGINDQNSVRAMEYEHS
jgi:hypothetical protein